MSYGYPLAKGYIREARRSECTLFFQVKSSGIGHPRIWVNGTIIEITVKSDRAWEQMDNNISLVDKGSEQFLGTKPLEKFTFMIQLDPSPGLSTTFSRRKHLSVGKFKLTRNSELEVEIF